MDTLCERNFMFFCRTVFEKNAMITCKIQRCTIVLINNFEILQVSIPFFSNTVRLRNLKFILRIDLYGYSLQKNFMFLGCTVIEKNAMMTCKIQSCKIVLIDNYEILQVSITFFSDTVQPRNLKFILYINPYGYSIKKNSCSSVTQFSRKMR